MQDATYVERPSGKGGVLYYPQNGQWVETLLAATAFLGVTRSRLGQLVGLPQAHKVHLWFRGKHCPSAKYYDRLVRLMILKLQGQLDIHTFNGSAYWYNLEHSRNGGAAE